MANADVAYIEVLPSAKNFLPNLRGATEPAAQAAGAEAGRSFGTSFGAASTNSVEKASTQMSTALRKVADAAGTVRVAEEKLNAVRDSGKATQVQIVAAEENLAKARRNETAANENLNLATRKVADAQNQHTTAARQGSVAMDEGTKKAGVLSSSFGVLSNAVAVGFGAFYAASGAISFIGSTISASRDLNETINKSTIIFGTNASVVDAWARGAAQSVGLSRAAALEAAAGFGNMYTQLGFSADAAAKMSIKTVQMAADLGSFNNLPTAEVAEMISAAFRGEYDSLQRLVPTISDATVKSEAMAMTGKTNADSLTMQEKATAVLSIITRDGSAAMGDFARTSGGLANQQKILSAEWDNAKAALGSLLIGPATAFTGWLIDVIPYVAAFGGWVQQNSEWLVPMGIYLGVVAGGLAVVTAAQWALNAAMAANPIGLVVIALAALAAGLVYVYTQSETFRTIVNAAFDAVAAAAMWMWTNAIEPAFRYIRNHWDEVSAAIVWTWDNILHPAWNAVAAVATWLWANVLQPTFQYISDHWRTIIDAMVWTWNNVLWPTWVVVSTIATWLWEQVLRPIFDFIALAWTAMVTVMTDVWNLVLHPMWDLLVAVLTLMWEGVLRPIFDIIGIQWTIMTNVMKTAWDLILHPMWDLLVATLQFLWNNVLQPIFAIIGATWDALLWAMKTVYDNILHPMLGLFADTMRAVQRVVEVVVEGIRTVWNSIKEAVATPINFMIGVVFNKGLFTAWNWVVDKLGLNKDWHAPTWSQIPEGKQYAEGGPIGGFSPHKKSDNIPIRATAGEFMQPVDSVRAYGVDAMEAVRQRRAAIYYADGGLIPGFATGGQIFDLFRAHFPNAKLNSAYRPGDPGYHGSNQAADMGEAGFSGGAGRPYIAAMKRWAVDNLGGAEEIIYTGLGNDRPNIKNGKAFNYSASVNSQHTNHLHVALAKALSAYAAGASFAGVTASGSAAVEPTWFETLWGSVEGAYSWLKDSIKTMAEIPGRFGTHDFLQIATALPPKMVDGMWDKIKGTVTDLFAALASAVVGGTNNDPAGVKGIVQGIFANAGWGSGAQWAAADWVIQQESGWNPTAQNKTSTASGLGQFINSTWAAYGNKQYPTMKSAPAADQGLAIRKYMGSRYGDPIKTKAFWEANHWYGEGGLIPAFHDGGHTRHWDREHVALMGPDERVFTPRQDDYFRRFVDAVGGGEGMGGKRMLAEKIEIHARDREEGRELMDRLWHKVKVADHGGVYTFTV